MATEKPPLLFMREEQSFRKHSRKYQSIEKKNNNGNRKYTEKNFKNPLQHALICKTQLCRHSQHLLRF